jgi:hypothetical protein
VGMDTVVNSLPMGISSDGRQARKSKSSYT